VRGVENRRIGTRHTIGVPRTARHKASTKKPLMRQCAPIPLRVSTPVSLNLQRHLNSSPDVWRTQYSHMPETCGKYEFFWKAISRIDWDCELCQEPLPPEIDPNIGLPPHLTEAMQHPMAYDFGVASRTPRRREPLIQTTSSDRIGWSCPTATVAS